MRSAKVQVKSGNAAGADADLALGNSWNFRHEATMIYFVQKWIIGLLIFAIVVVLAFDVRIEHWHMGASRLHSTALVPQLLMLATGLALAVSAIWYFSRAHNSKKFEIFLGEKLRVLATPVPFIDVGKINQAARRHEKEIQPIAAALRVEGDSVVVNLILRNTDKRTFEDTIVTVGANFPFKAETPGAMVVSPNEVCYRNQTIQPFKQAGIENFYSLRFSLTQPLTKICIWGLVQSGKIHPYLGVGCISYRKADEKLPNSPRPAHQGDRLSRAYPN